MSTYSLQNAARILKVRSSRLRYWKRTRLAEPRAAGGGEESAVVPSTGEKALSLEACVGCDTHKALINILVLFL